MGISTRRFIYRILLTLVSGVVIGGGEVKSFSRLKFIIPVLFIILFVPSKSFSQAWLEVDEGSGHYDYIEKKDSTWIHWGTSWGTWATAEVWADVNGAGISYPSVYVHDAGVDKHLSSSQELSWHHFPAANWTAGAALDYYFKLDSVDQAISLDELMIVDVQKQDIPGFIYNAPKQLVLQFSVDVGTNIGRELNRLWVQNDGTLLEGNGSDDINFDAVKLYYETGTILHFDGTEASENLWGDFAGNPTNNNQWGENSFASGAGIPIPSDGVNKLLCYVVIENFNGTLTVGRSAQFKIMSDGMNLDQFGTLNALGLVRINEQKNANALPMGVLASCPADFPVCLNSAPVTLSGATPAGGIYIGDGVTSNIFDPVIAGVGVHPITYSIGNQLVAYWNFNIGSSTLPWSFPIPADAGSGNGRIITGNWIPNLLTYTKGYNGSLLNTLFSAVAGSTLTLLRGPAAISMNGHYIQVECSMTGLSDLIISYWTQKSALAGFTNGQWSWSTDNSTFTNFGSSITLSNPGKVITISAPSLLNGVSTIYLKYTLTGATADAGDDRIDNMQLNASAAGTLPCTFNINVNALPTITGTLSVCSVSTTQLTGSGTAALVNPWVSATPAVAAVSSTGLVTGVAAGTSVITYTDINGCSNTATVTVNALPAISGTLTTCIGSSTQLTGSGTPASSNAWVSATPAVSTVNAITGVVTGVATGTSVITYTDINGCSTTATVTVNTQPTITGTLSVCVGSTTSLAGSGTPALSNAWVSATTSVATISATTGVVTGVAAGTSVITYTNDIGCTRTAIVTVNTLPVPAPATSGAACIGGILELTSAEFTSATYTWSGPNGFTSSLQNPLPITPVTALAAGTYSVTVLDANGCSGTGNVTVTVNTPPVATATTTTPTLCTNGTIFLFGGPNGMSTYNWSGPNSYSTSTAALNYLTDFNTNIASSGTSSLLPSGPGYQWALSETGANANATYSASTGSDNNGNTYSFGASGNSERALGGLLSGSLVPVIGASFNNSTASSIQTLIISYTGEQWRLGATARADRLEFQYSTNATSLTTGTWTNVNSLDFTAPVTASTVGPLDGNTAPNRTAITSSITGLSIASGATVWIRFTDLDAAGADDGLGVDDFSITFSSGSTQNPTIINATTLMSGTYTLLVTDPNGCTDTETVNVTVNPAPTATASATTPICVGATLNLTCNPSGGTGPYTFSWTGPNAYTSTAQNPSIANVTNLAAGIYTVVVTDALNCTVSAPTASVVINPSPIVNAGSNSPVCVGSTLNLISVNNTSTTTYGWSGPNGFTSSSASPIKINVGIIDAGVYNVTVTALNSCTSTASVNVVVNTLPVLSASSNSPVCLGSTIQLNGGPVGMSTYTWIGPNGYATTSSTITKTQNFDLLANSGTTNNWIDNSITFPDWYSQRTGTGTTYAADIGTANAGNLYSYGSAGASERALGSLGSGGLSAGNFAHGFQYLNTTGQTITDVKITYTLEQWRNGGSLSAQNITVWYKVSNSTISLLNPGAYSGWKLSPSLTLSSPIFVGASASLNGNAAANKISAINAPLQGLSLLNGQYLMIKWDDPDHPAADHGLAIDDIFITYTYGSEQNPSRLNATAPMAGTYTLTAVDGNGCSNTATALVVVNPTSVGGTAAAATSPICSGSSTTITVTGYTGTIQWQQSADGSTGWANVTGGSGATTATYTTPTLTTTNYYRAVVTSGVCTSAFSTVVSITVTTQPSATFSYSGSPYCPHTGIASVTFSGTTGGIYSSTTGLQIDPSTGNIDLAASTPATYTVTYTVTAAGGCAAVAPFTTVIIKPIATVTTIPDVPYCHGVTTAAINFSSTPSTVTPFSWSSSQNIGFGLSGTGSIPSFTANNVTAVPIIVTLLVKATLGGCAGLPVNFDITIYPKPAVTIKAKAFGTTNEISNICLGTAFDLYSTASPLVVDQPDLIYSESFEGDVSTWGKNTLPVDDPSRWTIRSSTPPYQTGTGGITPPYLPVLINSGSKFYLSDNTYGLTANSISLTSPPISTTGYTGVTLDFSNYYRDKGLGPGSGANDSACIDVRTDGGAWINNVKIFATTRGYPYSFQIESLDLKNYTGTSTIQIRFRFTPTSDFYWAIDNVKVFGIKSSTGFNLVWSSIPIGFSNNFNPSPTVSQTVTTTYTVKYTDQNSGCEGSNSILVSNYVTVRPSITSSPNVGTICTGATGVLLTSSLASSYQWNQYGSAVAGKTDQTFTSATSTAYYSVTTKDLNGCYSTSPDKWISVIPQPTAPPPLPATQTVCQNQVISGITVIPSGGTGTFSYQWYSNAVNSNSGGTTLGSANGANTATYTPPASATPGITYYYCVISQTGQNCGTISSATVVTVNPLPTTSPIYHQ